MRPTKKTITVLCPPAEQPTAKKIRADVYPCGLAIHRTLTHSLSDLYTVTHVPTGYSARCYIEGRKTAKAIVAAIATIFDWNSITTLVQWLAAPREQKALLLTTMERIEREPQRKEKP
jgi:hypothetical protein